MIVGLDFPVIGAFAEAGHLRFGFVDALVHDTVRPANDKAFPAMSRAMTVACVELPMVRAVMGALTLTAVTGTRTTVSAKVAEGAPPTVTPIDVLPLPTAVTTPAALTVPIAASADVQVAVRAPSGLPPDVPMAAPAESIAVAASACVCWGLSVPLVGDTLTLDTGTRSESIVSVSDTTPVAPGALAITSSPVPGVFSAVMVVTPVPDCAGVTVNRLASLVVQDMVRPTNGLLLASNACALSCRAYKVPT